MYKTYLFLACAFLVFYTTDTSAPPAFKICKSEDSKCTVETAKVFLPTFVAGIPEYHVETLEPLKIKSINASEGNLLFIVNDVTVVGLKNCEVINISRDKANSVIDLQLRCTATLDGYYILKGSVLVVPLQGKGKIHVDLKSALFGVKLFMGEKTGDDGKLHWIVKSFKFTFDLKEKSKVVFENLNKGNELLEQAGNALLESNANDVIKEIGFPVIQAIINIIIKNVNRLFKAIAAEYLSLD